MGLWKDLLRQAGRGDSALLSPGRRFPSEEGAAQPSFPHLGKSLSVSNDEPVDLNDIIYNNKKPSIVLIYSNC